MSSNLAGRTIKIKPLRLKIVRAFALLNFFPTLFPTFLQKMDITPCNSLAHLLRKIAYLHKLFQTVEFTTDNGYLPIMNTNKEYLPPLKPCTKCGKMPQRETSRPDGRTNDIYRYTCECGNCPLQWSVSDSAAIRLWNAYVAT